MNNALFPSPAYRVLGVLLDYPGEATAQALAETEDFLRRYKWTEPDLGPQLRQTLSWMHSLTLLDLQRSYVETFDLNPRHALYLTYHLMDEQDRRRGQALIKLKKHFEDAGLALRRHELPDYLPLMLEFAATLEPSNAARFLREADEALARLETNLANCGSPWANLVAVVRREASPPVARNQTTETQATA